MLSEVDVEWLDVLARAHGVTEFRVLGERDGDVVVGGVVPRGWSYFDVGGFEVEGEDLVGHRMVLTPLKPGAPDPRHPLRILDYIWDDS